ncbi:MAG: HNH endonuclease [Acidobacteriota bacterium]
MEPFIALTDKAWFDFLRRQAHGATIDEVNFWSPRSGRPLKNLLLGQPVFLRLKSPYQVIAGYGFFAHFCKLEVRTAWDLFDWKNGDPNLLRFLGRLGRYRGADLFDPRVEHPPLACTILRNARFWEPDRWLRWDEDMGWPPHVVRGRTERDQFRINRLHTEIAADGQKEPLELVQPFHLADTDERRIIASTTPAREGQATFRARLMDAYHRRCAISGERTEPVLDAAHIQPYLGPRSNHTQNGLLLTKEFHALFDKGLMTITADHRVRISPVLDRKWHNGRRYYSFDGHKLEVVPDDPACRPSPQALQWHQQRIFRNA